MRAIPWGGEKPHPPVWDCHGVMVMVAALGWRCAMQPLFSEKESELSEKDEHNGSPLYVF